jgi:hypothetical protein
MRTLIFPGYEASCLLSFPTQEVESHDTKSMIFFMKFYPVNKF